VPNRPAAALGLRAGDREELERLTRSSSVRAGLAQRARIVLLAADGVSNTWIAEVVGVSRPTVLGWRARYAARGLAGLGEEARSGRPRQVDYRQIVAATLRPPPRKYAVTHWSSRLLARHLKIGDATVARAWREYGVAPWRAESFRFSTDPQLEAKVVDVVGLYLHPPARAVVLCVDEKSQIQPLDRTAPILPLQPGLGRAPLARLRPARHLDPVHRAGDRYRSGHRGLQTPPPPPGVPGLPLPGRPRLSRRPALHLVMDNYAAHKHPAVQTWLAANPRVVVHFTPTHASWMTWSKSGSRSSNAKPSTAAPSAPSATSTPRSAPSSLAGTAALTLHLDQDRRPDPQEGKP